MILPLSLSIWCVTWNCWNCAFKSINKYRPPTHTYKNITFTRALAPDLHRKHAFYVNSFFNTSRKYKDITNRIYQIGFNTVKVQ